MYRTVIQEVNGLTAVDINGRTLSIAGNDAIAPGKPVWTDGKIVYGQHMVATAAPAAISENISYATHLKGLFHIYAPESVFMSNTNNIRVVGSYYDTSFYVFPENEVPLAARINKDKSVYYITVDEEASYDNTNQSECIRQNINKRVVEASIYHYDQHGNVGTIKTNGRTRVKRNLKLNMNTLDGKEGSKPAVQTIEIRIDDVLDLRDKLIDECYAFMNSQDDPEYIGRFYFIEERSTEPFSEGNEGLIDSFKLFLVDVNMAADGIYFTCRIQARSRLFAGCHSHTEHSKTWIADTEFMQKYFTFDKEYQIWNYNGDNRSYPDDLIDAWDEYVNEKKIGDDGKEHYVRKGQEIKKIASEDGKYLCGFTVRTVEKGNRTEYWVYPHVITVSVFQKLTGTERELYRNGSTRETKYSPSHALIGFDGYGDGTVILKYGFDEERAGYCLKERQVVNYRTSAGFVSERKENDFSDFSSVRIQMNEKISLEIKKDKNSGFRADYPFVTTLHDSGRKIGDVEPGIIVKSVQEFRGMYYCTAISTVDSSKVFFCFALDVNGNYYELPTDITEFAFTPHDGQMMEAAFYRIQYDMIEYESPTSNKQMAFDVLKYHVPSTYMIPRLAPYRLPIPEEAKKEGDS